MEFVVNSNTIILAATIITSLGVIWGMISRLIKFVEHNKVQDEKIDELMAELKKYIALDQREKVILCGGIVSCLEGMKELGCNGNVTVALDRLKEHLNEAAHGE